MMNTAKKSPPIKTTSLFHVVPYFNEKENWGDHTKVSGLLVLALVQIRELVGSPFKINCAFDTKGHATKSQHYVGNAVDGVFTKISFPVAIVRVEKALQALQLDTRMGLGIYPQWRTPGFHFDVRGMRARWGWLDGKQAPYPKVRAFAMGKTKK